MNRPRHLAVHAFVHASPSRAAWFGFWSLLAGCSDGVGTGTPNQIAGNAGSAPAGAGVSGAGAGDAVTFAGSGGVAAGGGFGGGFAGGAAAAAATAAGAAGVAGLGMGGAAASIGVFVAQGHQGRVTRSCDDGRSFPHDHSQDDAYRCFSDEQHDCDHSAWAGRGLAFGQGSLVATWGWGEPGKVQRSVDGRQWADVLTETPTFADVAYGNSLFVACGNPTRVSVDGVTWQLGGELGFDFNYRGIEFVPAGGGTFVVVGELGEQRAISISHDGKDWRAAVERPPLCGQELRGIAGSDAVVVLASAQGHVCRSVDGGQRWTHHPVSERFTSPPLWTGSAFWIYEGDVRWQSGDGEVWTSQPITPSRIAIGALARSPAGTLVAANDGWQVWYEKQQLFRSTDGASWELLPPGSFNGSHPISFLSFGYLAPSPECGVP